MPAGTLYINTSREIHVFQTHFLTPFSLQYAKIMKGADNQGSYARESLEKGAATSSPKKRDNENPEANGSSQNQVMQDTTSANEDIGNRTII